MTEFRLRSRLSPTALDRQVGKLLTPLDWDVQLTGHAKVIKPDGRLLCVYLPGVLKATTDDPDVYRVLHGLRNQRTDNRGLASGTPRVKSGHSRFRTREVSSAIVGAIDPGGQLQYCRLTAWTGRNLPEWEALRPLLRHVSGLLREYVPDRWLAQYREVERTDPAWVVPDTVFSTVTVNNSYATGTHTDKGDLDAGFSTIACLRRGTYTGGCLVFPEWRVSVDMRDGDLLLMDAHEWHGNQQLTCACGEPMNGMCEAKGNGVLGGCGAERISVVSYMRTNMVHCGSPADEYAKAQARETRTRAAKPGRSDD
jgi:hypothetical protein